MASAGPSQVAPSTPPAGAADEATLDRLVQRAISADMSIRSSFAASLWKRAAAVATALHGAETFAAAYCTLKQAFSLCGQSGVEVSPVDKAALKAEAWALVSSVLPLLSTRMEDNTLLPGRCTREEVEFFKRFRLATHAANNAPPPPARGLQVHGFGVGYAVTLNAAVLLLRQFVHDPHLPPAALVFVLRAVDMVRAAA